MKIRIFYALVVFAFSMTIFSCKKLDDPTPTNDLMEGVWEVTEVKNANDSDITKSVSPLVVANLIHLNSSNSVNSTAGPLFMYLVYGNSKFVKIASQLDQAFKYGDADFGLTEGEWGIKKGEVTDHFTIEMKLKFPGQQTITDLLEIMGINPPSFMEPVIYHKFMNVKVVINDENPELMYWVFDDETTPEYNIKDENLHYQLWNGISTNVFSRCTIKLEKRVTAITDMVNDAYAK